MAKNNQQRRTKTAGSLQASILSRLKKTKRPPETASGSSSTPLPEPEPKPQPTSITLQKDPVQDKSPSSSNVSSSNDVKVSNLYSNQDAKLKRKRQDDKESANPLVEKDPLSDSDVQKKKKNNQKDGQDLVIEKTSGSQGAKQRKKNEMFVEDGSKLISEFHRIEKQLSQRNLDPLTRHKLKIEQKKLGGLEAYQKASKIGGAIQNGGETGKWCAKTMIKLGLRPSPHLASDKKIKLLDVGAIDGKSYSKYKDWILTTSIDINPKDDESQVKVLKYDFFEFPLPQNEDEKYDVVCLSLVLNFVGDLKKRGEMIKRAKKFIKTGGNLFIALPLACLNNSRYLDSTRFEEILNYLGFNLLVQHDSSKLTYWFLKKNLDTQNLREISKDELNDTANYHHKDFKKYTLKFPKVQIRSGLNRNNFCIKV